MKDTGQNFIVSMFRDVTSEFSKYPVISASLLSKDCPDAYQDRKFGYLYCPRSEQIIGMAPTDLSLAASDCLGLEYTEARVDLLLTLLRTLTGVIQLDCGLQLIGNFSDFRRIYDLSDFKEKTQDYNEIILRGDTEPVAIFTKQEALSYAADDLCALCKVTRLPLVIWEKDRTLVNSLF